MKIKIKNINSKKKKRIREVETRVIDLVTCLRSPCNDQTLGSLFTLTRTQSCLISETRR